MLCNFFIHLLLIEIKSDTVFYQYRIGLQGDVNDPRTKSFLYILDILPRSDQAVLSACFI